MLIKTAHMGRFSWHLAHKMRVVLQVDEARTRLLFSNVFNLDMILQGRPGERADGFQLLKEVTGGATTYIQTGPKLYGSFLGFILDSERDCVKWAGGVMVERCENNPFLFLFLTVLVSNSIRMGSPCLLGASDPGHVTQQNCPNVKVVTWGSRGAVRILRP